MGAVLRLPNQEGYSRERSELTTLVSYPERGKDGQNSWRGNCSGRLLEDIFSWYKPKKVFDPMVGGGTTKDVCERMGINHYVLDLNPKWGGWNALKDEVPESADFIFWHPPYHDMVLYSGKMWGENPHPDDLSRCASYQEFIDKLNTVQAKLLAALRKGGRMAVLVGDIKSKGVLYSIQKDMAWLGAPEQVIIKTQHNCVSDKRTYARKFIPIVHEYLLVFRRDDCYIIPSRLVKEVGVDLRTRERLTWRDVVHAAMEALGGRATLEGLYREVEGHAKTKTNPHWQDQIRKVLQKCSDFVNLSRGEWAFSY